VSFLDKARQAAEQARLAAAARAQQAQARIAEQAPIIQAQTREGLGVAGQNLKVGARSAKKGMAGIVDRIDPGILADIIIKATALQEKANESLRAKGSPYRIGEITITAALPPQVGFAIARIGDVEEELTGHEVESAQLIDQLAIADMSMEELAATSDGDDGAAGSLGDGTDPSATAGEAAISSADAAASFADAAASSADAAASFADAAEPAVTADADELRGAAPGDDMPWPPPSDPANG
jgi:hypothetical protein